jgi:outer membrane protein assembly factor BamD
MFKRFLSLIVLIAAIFTMNSCSKYQRLLKGTDYDAKYNAAVKYYEKKDYYRCLQLLEELIVIFRGTGKGEDVYYYYAKCNYATRDYTAAAYHFENFIKTFPSSPRAEECAFLVAYCYYLDSPSSSLDQENTILAIEQFQLFINHYPQSEKVAESNKLMDELLLKIETKAFNNAKTFYYIEEYKAAVASLNNVIRDYPGTVYKEECLYLILKSYYLYAQKSIEEKKLERYKSALEAYQALKESFPESAYLRQVESTRLAVVREMKELEGYPKTGKNN